MGVPYPQLVRFSHYLVLLIDVYLEKDRGKSVIFKYGTRPQSKLRTHASQFLYILARVHGLCPEERIQLMKPIFENSR